MKLKFGSSPFSSVTQDKWKNLQIRSGNPPKLRKKATPPPPEPSASADEREEIDISDSDDAAPRGPVTRARAVKKRRTAALVATASFAAVRNAELSQSQADSLDLESYHSVDNSYEVEEMMQESEDEQERDESESQPTETAAAAAANQPTPRKTHAPAPKPTARAAAKAKAPAPEAASSVSTAAKAKKTVRESSAETPKAAVSGLSKFQFATDDTYPEVRTALISNAVIMWNLVGLSNTWQYGR